MRAYVIGRRGRGCGRRADLLEVRSNGGFLVCGRRVVGGGGNLALDAAGIRPPRCRWSNSLRLLLVVTTRALGVVRPVSIWGVRVAWDFRPRGVVMGGLPFDGVRPAALVVATRAAQGFCIVACRPPRCRWSNSLRLLLAVSTRALGVVNSVSC